MAASGYIYWTDQGTDKVQCADLDGNGIIDLQTGLNTPRGIDLHIANEHIYWTDSIISYIRRCDFDGSNMTPILSGVQSQFQGITVDEINGHLYTAGNSSDAPFDQVSRHDLDGSNSVIIVSGTEPDPAKQTNPVDVAIDLDNNKLYWAETRSADGVSHSGFIGLANLDGSSSGTLISPLDPVDITLDNVNNKLYWANAGTHIVDYGSICRSNLDGSNIETLISGLSRPHGVTIDTNNDTMYYTEVLLGTIHRYDLNGSNIITVVSGLTNPQRIVVHSLSSTPESSDLPLRIIHRLTRVGDYNPQLIGAFNEGISSVNIRIWDVINGANIPVILPNSGCYAIGNTNKWGWSTAYLPFASGYNNYHYYFEMAANTGETDYGEFFLTVPEHGRWVYP